VGARERDRRALGAPGDVEDVAADALPVPVVLPRHLLVDGQDRLQVADVDPHVAGRPVRLDDPCDRVARLAAVGAEHLHVLRVAEPLHDDGAGRRGGDAAETGGSVVELPDRGAVLVELGRVDADLAGPSVDLRSRLLDGARLAVVGHQERLLDGVQEGRQRDATLGLDHPQCRHVDVHLRPP